MKNQNYFEDALKAVEMDTAETELILASDPADDVIAEEMEASIHDRRSRK